VVALAAVAIRQVPATAQAHALARKSERQGCWKKGVFIRLSG
jgi:hypothetical protein